jgi:hypothetical protein
MTHLLRRLAWIAAWTLAPQPVTSCELVVAPGSLQNGVRQGNVGDDATPGIGSIACAALTCTGPREVCCAGSSNGEGTCASTCPLGSDIFTCAGASNCGQKVCCVMLGVAMGGDLAQCQSACIRASVHGGPFQVCQTSSECPSGEQCVQTVDAAFPICVPKGEISDSGLQAEVGPASGPISCGPSTCTGPQEDCCPDVDGGSLCASRGGCPPGTDVYRCSGAANCAKGQVCCLALGAAAGGDLAQCQNVCATGVYGPFQVCETPSECASGGPCTATANAALRICEPSAPPDDGGGG